MKKALFLISAAIAMLTVFFCIAMWYLGMIWVFPMMLAAGAVWYLVLFKKYEKLSLAVKIVIQVVLWLAAAATMASPYVLIWLVLQGELHQ